MKKELLQFLRNVKIIFYFCSSAYSNDTIFLLNNTTIRIRARLSSVNPTERNYEDIAPGEIFKWKKSSVEKENTFQMQIDTNNKDENETIYLVKQGYLYVYNRLFFLTYLDNVCVPISKDEFGDELSEVLEESKTQFEETLYGKVPFLTPRKIYSQVLVRKYSELKEDNILIQNKSKEQFIDIRIRLKTLGSDDFFTVETNKWGLWRRVKGKYLVEILTSNHESSRFYVETGFQYLYRDDHKLFNISKDNLAEQVTDLFSHITYITKLNSKLGGFENIDILYEKNQIYDIKNKDYTVPYFNNVAPVYFPGQKFKDETFPPNSISLNGKGFNGLILKPHFKHSPPEDFKDGAPEFKTPAEIFHNKPYYLFKDQIECNDVRQGVLGNCYLISIIAALSERHDLISKIFKSRTLNRDGFYEIFYYETDGTKHIMYIDDYFPYLDMTGSGKKESLCAISNGEEIWVMLLEKAYAKYEGGWANIQGGLISPELKFFTGCNTKDINLGSTTAWQEILDACRRNNIVCCRSAKGSGNHDNISDKNIANSHAYSILEAEEYKGIRLLKIRNPWGDVEWTGDFSDSSPLWTQELREYFNFIQGVQNDGIFCMKFEDFCREFSNVVICYC